MTRQLSPRPQHGPWLAAVLAAIGVSLLLFIALTAYRSQTSPPIAEPSPTATATATAVAATTPPAATAAATPTAAAPTELAGPCANRYIAGDEAIVPPRDAGQHLDVAFDDVFGSSGNTSRWAVRFFVPQGAPGNAVVPLSASVTGPSGRLTIGRYEYGPPNAGTLPTTEPVTVEPCDASAPPGIGRGAVVVVFETNRVSSGSYTLRWDEIRLPEGGFRDESWTVTLTCDGSGACK